jgi:hypothetical protein
MKNQPNPINAKNAEHLGLRFSTTFTQMSNAFFAKVVIYNMHLLNWFKDFSTKRNPVLIFLIIFAPLETVIFVFDKTIKFPNKSTLAVKDNIPSRLTSVAHLGGLFFYRPLAL